MYFILSEKNHMPTYLKQFTCQYGGGDVGSMTFQGSEEGLGEHESSVR